MAVDKAHEVCVLEKFIIERGRQMISKYFIKSLTMLSTNIRQQEKQIQEGSILENNH